MKQYDETKLPYKGKLALEYMIDSLNEAQAEVAKYKDLTEQNWKIQQFKPYLRDTFEFTWSQPHGYYGGRRDVKGRWSHTYWGDDMELKTTNEEIAQMKVKDAETYKENQAIAAQNSIYFKRLTDLMTTMGIKQTMPDPKSRKMFKPDIKMGFVRDIEVQCKTYAPPPPDWNSIEDSIQRRAEKKRIAELEIQKKKVVEETEKEKNKVIIGLIKKYDINVDDGLPDAEEILEIILEKDKYLRLAHYLLKNREDWNDGYSYAECGLNGFVVETETDKLIEEDIYSCMGKNWDGDGRVFRDTKYNYDVLFGMAGEEIYSDYEMINKYIEKF